MFDVVLLYLLLATVFPLGRLAVTSYAQPIFFTGVRMALAGGVLFLFYFIHYPDRFKQFFKLRFLPLWLVLAVFNIYLTNVLEFWGLQTLPAGKACFIYNVSPFFAALFSYFFFHERMTTKKWVGMVIGLIGLLPLLLHQSPDEQSLGGFFFLSWAEIALLGAAAATAFGWIIMRHMVYRITYPPILANAISMLLGAMIIFPTSLLLEQWNPLPIYNICGFWWSVIVIALISNILGYNIYASLLKRYTATFLSFSGFMSPLIAAVQGWFFLDERITRHFFMSACAVFCGLYIFYQEELRQGYIRRSFGKG